MDIDVAPLSGTTVGAWGHVVASAAPVYLRAPEARGMTMERFSDNSTPENRALQAWLILAGCAARRETLTYTQLCERMGYGSVKAVGKILGRVMYFCQAANLPPLTILVVNKNTGRPGVGLALYNDRDVLRERVYKHNWYGLVPPTPAELAVAWESEGEEFEVDEE